MSEKHTNKNKNKNEHTNIIEKKKYILRTNKKIMLVIIIATLVLMLNGLTAYASSEPVLIKKMKAAFEKIQEYMILVATPAAGVSICTGLLMRKFSFGDEEKVRTAKKIIRGTVIAYVLILSTNLILNFILILVK